MIFAFEQRIERIDSEREPERFMRAVQARKDAAHRVWLHFKRDRAQYRDSEWDEHIDRGHSKALEKGDPEVFCWTLLLAMGLGGPDIPVEQRDGPAIDAMQQWSDLAAATGLLHE